MELVIFLPQTGIPYKIRTKSFFVHDKLDIIEFHTNILAQFPVFYLDENQMYNSIAEIDDYDL